MAIWRQEVVMCPHRGKDLASGHPGAHQPPLGRGTSTLAWDGHLDAPTPVLLTASLRVHRDNAVSCLMAAVGMPDLPGARGSRDWTALIHACIGKSRSVCPAPWSGNTLAGRPCFLSICQANSCIMAAPISEAPVVSLTVVMGAKTLPRHRRTIPRADGRSCVPLSKNTCCCS